MPPSITSAARAVTGIERVWLAAGRIAPPFAPAWVVEGQGDLPLAAWQAALAQVLAARPLLAPRLVGRGRALRWVAGGPPPTVRVAPGPWDGQGSAGAPWLDTPMRPNRDPMVDLTWQPGPAARLAVRAHHALCDGRGLQRLAALLAAAVRGEPTPPEGVDAAGAPWAVPTLPRAQAADPQPDPPADHRAPSPPVGRDPTVRWARRSGPVPPAVTATLAVRLATLAGHPQRISVPVDLRRDGPAADTVHNLTGLVRLTVAPGEAVAAVQARLAAEVAGPAPYGTVRAAEALRGVPLWVMAQVGRAAVRRSLAQDAWVATAVISNLGRVDLAALSAPGFAAQRAFLVPPGQPGVPLFLTVAGGPAGLELAGAGPAACVGGGRLEALLDGLLAG